MVCDKLQASRIQSRLGRLNPYSIGIWSATHCYCTDKAFDACLNPYSIGIWSATLLSIANKQGWNVLILILLEYGLRQQDAVSSATVVAVLILILLEYGLRRGQKGRSVLLRMVLILILLEYGLRLSCENS